MSRDTNDTASVNEGTIPWIIDGDGHAVEPDEMWDRYLPERYRELAPRLGTASTPGPVATRAGHGSEASARAVPKMLSIAGGHTPSARLPDMDVDLIERSVVYPTLGLLIENVGDREAALALHRAANDWMADYCAYDQRRLMGVGALPSTNGDDALAEARRCVEELGFRAVFRHPPLFPGTLAVHDPAFEPLWDYLEQAGIPIVCHSGAAPAYCTDRYTDFIASHVIHFVAEAMMALTSLTLYGVLERHPALRVGLVEAGATWARSLCHRLDEHVEKATETTVHYSMPADVKLSLTPSEYFARQCFVTVEEVEPGLPEMLEQFPHNVLFATDYPHPDGVFPGSTAALLGTTKLTEVQRRAVLRDNAMLLYGLDV